MDNVITIVSLVVNVILGVVSVALTVANWKADKRSKSQVKIWMEQANGVQLALDRIIKDKWQGLYSGINDMASAVWAVHSSAFSLYQSLYEERVLNEDRYINEQIEQREYVKKQLRKNSTQKKAAEAIESIPDMPNKMSNKKSKIRS